MIKEKYKCSFEKIKNLDTKVPINLVLSGGAEKGVAHIALLEKLEELNIKINSISACSAGSLVGAMYTSGMKPKEILNFFKNTEIFQFSWITIAKPGIFNSSNYARLIDDKIKPTFEDLEIPLIVSTTNLNKGTTEYFNEGSLLKPVLASCALPGLFNPVKIGDALYSDGGIIDNFPTTPFKQSEYPIVGSYVVYPSEKTSEELNTTLKVLAHTSKLLMLSSEEYKFFETYATICFPLGEFSGFSTKEVDSIYETAKKYINKKLEERIN
ncbi:patatin-like phospholipase family protein [Tenacibaculum sp. Mcav3-52]|uniref:patatin-like phospholipase family protein n=1 Tax=Tenacibaculum sp. Mcav3-52 TaxID=2917762 RepID=UPI001EF3D22D|nr:patatin-like phospholipase family protein [Tenacibaculum sp. Mcav3-52]MCG7502253.1 patatin-like phospholipase family protein [Tenacibaculum sp. Mcav3-52]